MKVVYTGTLRPPKTDSKRKSGIVYWGNFINFHGVGKFIDSIKVLREKYGNGEKVILMGKGEKKKECENKVEKKGIKNVEFLGFVKKSELEKRISQAKLTVGVFGENQYMNTCITNKVCEAAARGKAIITKESPAIKEVFEDEKSIIMTHKNDVNEIAKDIHKTLTNEKKINYLGENSKKMFEGNLTPEKVAEQLLGTRSN
jgi:glycosyltransferase involved in cell wall biosynthesis